MHKSDLNTHGEIPQAENIRLRGGQADRCIRKVLNEGIRFFLLHFVKTLLQGLADRSITPQLNHNLLVLSTRSQSNDNYTNE